MQIADLPQEVLSFLDGVVLKARQRPLNEGEKYVLRGIWAGQTYDEMVERSGGKYSKGYLMQSVGPKILKFLSRELEMDLNKGNFRATLEREVNFSVASLESRRSSISEITGVAQTMPSRPINHFDETLDVSKGAFFGRTRELAELNTLICDPQLRLTILRGFAGIGKSSLAYLVANQQIETEEFDAVIFMSLRQRRRLIDFIQDVLQKAFNVQELSGVAEGEAPTETSSISTLIQFLSNFRCLLIIDNFDTVFRDEGFLDFDATGEQYQELIEQFASTGHRSHILVTCRTFPQAIVENSLMGRPVRQIDLSGLKSTDVQDILESKRLRDVTSETVQQLTSRLGGVPLGIRLAIADIQNRYSGSLSQYIADARIPESLETLIRTLIEKLSEPEQVLLYRVASYGRAVAYSELLDDTSDDVFDDLKDYIESLRGRSLLLLDDRKRYDVHPLVAEISREKVLQDCINDIRSLSFDKLDAVILVKSSADESDRQAQVNSVLEPLQTELRKTFSTDQEIVNQLKRCVEKLQASKQWRRYAAGNLFNLLRGLGIDLEGWDFSGLVLQQADFRGVNLRRVNFANVELIDCAIPESLGCPDTVVFSPTEDKIAVGDADGKVRIWRFDGTTWQFDRAFAREHAGWIWSLAFSPDGELLASGGDDGTVRLWRVNGKKNRSFLPPLEHGGSVKSVAFSPNFYCGVRGNDRGLIMATNDEGEVKLWDASAAFEVVSGAELETIKPIRIATSPVHKDATVFACASETGEVQMWAWSSHKLESKWKYSLHQDAIYALAFSPDGKVLATGTADGSVGFWWTETGEAVHDLSDSRTKHSDSVWSIAFSRDGQLVASAGYDGAILLWEMEEGICFRALKQHRGKVLGVTFNQTSRLSEYLLVSASDDKTVRSTKIIPDSEAVENWRVQPNHVFVGLTSWIWQLAFNSKGDILAAACDDGRVVLLRCDAAVDEMRLEFDQVLRTDITRTWAVVFSPNSEVLATGGSDNQIKLFDMASRNQVDCLVGHTDPVRALAFSADGHVLASASADSTVILFDLRDLEEYVSEYRRGGNQHRSNQSDGIVEAIATLTDHTEQVWTVTFSHDDRILATAGADGEIILYRFERGTDDIFTAFVPFRRKSEVKKDALSGHTDTVWVLAFTPDDSLLISGSSDRTIKLWDTKTGECVATLEGHTDQVHALSISPDGKYLISSGNDLAIKVWDIQKRELTATLENVHQHWIWAIAFHPNCPSLFASGSLDEVISLRQVDDSTSEVVRYVNQPFASSNIQGMIGSSAEKERFLELGATTDLDRDDFT